MTDTAYRDDIVFYGSRVAAGDLDRDAAVEQLVEVSAHRLSQRDARQLIDTWQGYLTPNRPPAPARSALLRRLFTRRTTNPKGTTTR
ncbi:hypothetical protein [Streptomyces sp. AS02]|uniref:hypothetical protein n=1 Tax=Streptomyces sp. AS02 TaxID=2938946 RepID=UPI0020203B42|nr:hypothetical protein [Streptomyces sp. AS02]MCL8016914.1 hypothetical protein [Streptomyces sp. AS02]